MEMAVTPDDKPILERIEKVLAELSKSITPTIDQPVPHVAKIDHIQTPPSTPPSASAAARLAMASAWMRSRAQRGDAFGGDLFFDPAWSILLELYVHHRQRTAMSITSLCVAAKIPPSTGLRWIALLEKRGLVNRESDPFDRRKSYAILTEDAIGRIEKALDGAMEANRQLGVEGSARVN